MKKFSPSCCLVLALSHWFSVGLGCSPEGQRELSLSEKVHHAHSVFVGMVVGMYQDPKFDYGGEIEVYLAEMEVSCVYKTPPGFQIPALVNVTDVGTVPGHCHQSKLYMNRKYIVLTLNDRHKIMDKEVPATDSNLNTALKVCGLQLQNPTGTNAASDCRQPADSATCRTVVDYGEHDHSHPEDHDHDHDGIPDHSAEEHGHDHSHSDGSNTSSEEHHGHDHDDDHDHDHDGQPDHTHSEHPHDHDHDHDHSHLEDHDHDHDGTADHSDADHPWDHDHTHSQDHDHDHDGIPDHTDEDHPWDHDHSHADDHDHDHDGKADHDDSYHDKNNGVTPDGAAVAAGHSGSSSVSASSILLLLGFFLLHHNLI